MNWFKKRKQEMVQEKVQESQEKIQKKIQEKVEGLISKMTEEYTVYDSMQENYKSEAIEVWFFYRSPEDVGWVG